MAPLTSWLILDIATAPLPNAAEYLDGTVRAPSNYKDEKKIAEYIAEKAVERLQMAATDIDLSRVTGLASLLRGGDDPMAHLCRDESDERIEFEALAHWIGDTRPTLITYGGLNFDLPLLMRRARYLGVDFPTLNLDRYKSPHVDLCEVLSDRNPGRRRSLDFYTKRLGWSDLMPKPLSGADEARVPETGQWDLLAESLKRDVTAIYRLSLWLGMIQPVHEMSPEQEAVGL